MKFRVEAVQDGKRYEWIAEEGGHRLLVDGLESGFRIRSSGQRFVATKNGHLVRGKYIRRWATLLAAKRGVEVLAGRRCAIERRNAPRYVGHHHTVQDQSPLAERRVSNRELRDVGGWQPIEDP